MEGKCGTQGWCDPSYDFEIVFWVPNLSRTTRLSGHFNFGKAVTSALLESRFHAFRLRVEQSREQAPQNDQEELRRQMASLSSQEPAEEREGRSKSKKKSIKRRRGDTKSREPVGSGCSGDDEAEDRHRAYLETTQYRIDNISKFNFYYKIIKIKKILVSVFKVLYPESVKYFDDFIKEYGSHIRNKSPLASEMEATFEEFVESKEIENTKRLRSRDE